MKERSLLIAEIKKINPETAAHNIATLFSSKYINNQKDISVLSPDSTELYDAAKSAANLYALAYDVAYEYFFNENEKND